MGHSPATPDAELVRAVEVDRSNAAFNILYDRHTPRVLRTVWRILGGDDHEAEDTMQDAWVRAIATLGTWQHGGGFGAWLRGIAIHVALDRIRRNRRLSFDEDLDPPAAESAEHIDLETVIAELAPGYRAVLVLHDIEGYTHEEIGERLGITAGTSKGQLFKARRAVRARLSPRTAEKR
jgi:RNA polymerase sigma-70 factor (ECF subfamily)